MTRIVKCSTDPLKISVNAPDHWIGCMFSSSKSLGDVEVHSLKLSCLSVPLSFSFLFMFIVWICWCFPTFWHYNEHNSTQKICKSRYMQMTWTFPSFTWWVSCEAQGVLAFSNLPLYTFLIIIAPGSNILYSSPSFLCSDHGVKRHLNGESKSQKSSQEVETGLHVKYIQGQTQYQWHQYIEKNLSWQLSKLRLFKWPKANGEINTNMEQDYKHIANKRDILEIYMLWRIRLDIASPCMFPKNRDPSTGSDPRCKTIFSSWGSK